jgi:hypothetical protein
MVAAAPPTDLPVPIGQAATLFPPGRTVHVKTIRLWALVGIRGVKLPSFLIGGRRFVNRAGVEKFLHDLNRGENNGTAVLDPQTGGPDQPVGGVQAEEQLATV